MPVKFNVEEKSHLEEMIKNFFIVFSLLALSLCACSAGSAEVTPTPSPSSTVIPSLTATHTSTCTPTLTPTATLTPTPIPQFSFVVTSDMSHYSAQEYLVYPNFFAGLLGYVKQYGPGDFMISVGDVIPAAGTSWTIDQVMGEGYPWFPLPGNHDFGISDFNFLRDYDYESNGDLEFDRFQRGPEFCPQTTYSFDYQNTHFVALNVYCNEKAPWGIDGSISDTLFQWLTADLEATSQEHIFVFGHEPAFPQPDAKTGDVRHLYESLDQYPEARDRFWKLLKSHEVVAYIAGHSHNYSAVQIDGLWQVEAGQAMGVRAAPSPGTFLIFTITGDVVSMNTYRGEDGPGFAFEHFEEIRLRP